MNLIKLMTSVDLMLFLAGIILGMLWTALPLLYYFFDRNNQAMTELYWAEEKIDKEKIPQSEKYKILIKLNEIHYKQMIKVSFFGWLFFILPIQKWIMKLPEINDKK